MRNKRKGILMASAILGSAAIVSTGFAAWVITTPTTAAVEGNIEVDTVKDNRITMTASWKNNTEGAWNVVFGAPATQGTANHWLTNGGTGAKVESISNEIVISMAWKDNTRAKADLDGTITVKFEVGTKTRENFVVDEDFESTLIELPTFSASYAVSDGVVSNIPVAFGWGSDFADNEGTPANPYTYFNSKSPNVVATNHRLAVDGNTWADVAYATLSDLEDLSANHFKVTLTFALTNPNA